MSYHSGFMNQINDLVDKVPSPYQPKTISISYDGRKNPTVTLFYVSDEGVTIPVDIKIKLSSRSVISITSTKDEKIAKPYLEIARKIMNLYTSL